METRSRRRAEAIARRPSPAKNTRSKRARIPAPSSSSAPQQRRSSARIQTLSAQKTAESPMESSGLPAGRDRNSKQPARSSDRNRGQGVQKNGRQREAAAGAELQRQRQRQREREPDRILSADGGEDEGNEEEEEEEEEGLDHGAGRFNGEIAYRGNALGFLRKFVSGIEGLAPAPAVWKRILAGLRAEGEIGRQIEALTELCEIVSMGTEDSLSNFAVESFAPVLVGLLNCESNSDVMLLAARALTHLCDVLPSFCSAAVHYGAVRCLCARLLTIEYMDLAEQSLQALKKISHEHPVACLRAGALMAVLSYLDFFSTGVQRVALSTAANICKHLPSDLADFAMAAVPTLTNLLSSHDSKVVEHASVCLARIVESLASSPQNLDELCNHGLVSQAAQLISANSAGSAQSSISTSTYTGVIRLLSTCTSGSVLSAKTLLDIGISGILRDTLVGPAIISRMSVPPSLNRSWDQLYEIVSLVNELLPSLPPGVIFLPTGAKIGLNNSVRKHTTRNGTGKAEDIGKTKAEISPREKLFRDQPELLARFGMDLFPVVVQVYGSSVNSLIRHKCLAAISKLSYLSTADMLKSLLRVTNISSFLAGVLSCKDPQVLIPALQIAEVLMKKLPDVFSKMFLKEGVVYAIDMLISSGLSSVSCVQASTSGKDQVVSIGAVPKIRRNRRHSGISEVTRLEEAKDSISMRACSSPSQDAAVSGAQATVCAYAKHFKDTCFPGYSGSVGAGATDSLRKLKSLCRKLNALANPKVKMKGKAKVSSAVAAHNHQLFTVVSDMFAELSKGDGVSTFEFLGSGIVASLLNLFSCDGLHKENMSESDLMKHCQQALKRLELFIGVSLPMNYNEGREVPLTILVRKLQDALTSLERFPVFLSHAPRNGNASTSEGLPALSQHFKLRLCRAQGEKFLRDYSSTVIRINPSASLAAVEDFLWPRVQRNESIQMCSIAAAADSSAGQPAMSGTSSLTRSISTQVASEHRPSTRSRSSITAGNATAKKLDCANAGLSKGKGKAASECLPDDRRGPQTRNAIRRRTALEKALQLKQQQGETGVEDEDLDVCPHELDGTAAMEDDIFDDDDDDDQDEDEDNEDYERVHDVRLGDAVGAGTEASTSATAGEIALHSSSAVASRAAIFAESGETGELRTSLGLKGSLSFATAAMAGNAFHCTKDARGSRDYQALPLANSGNACPRLNFFLGGKQLNRSSTVYQAIQCHAVVDESGERYAALEFSQNHGRKLWDDVHNITYQRADIPVERTCIGSQVNGLIPEIVKNGLNSNSSLEPLGQHVYLIGSILQGKLPCDLEKSNCPYDILLLLRVVESLNHLAPRLRAQDALGAFAEGKISLDELQVKGPIVAQEEFLSSKLTPKLVCQMQDALALCKGNLPSWCHQLTKACPFLFPFETRRHYFCLTAFGLSRALKCLQQQQSVEYPNLTNDRERHGGRLARQKVRVSRNRILESAAKVMEMYAGQNAVLEVEYFGEVGTGLGPTLEFYTLLSHELQRSGLGMWRCSYPVESGAEMLDVPSLPIKKDSQEVAVVNGEFVKATLGLFPCPYPPNMDSADGSQFSKAIDYFHLLGQVMAKALQDGRLLDLPLSTAFYKLVLGQELDLYDIQTFDLELGTTMQEMQALVCRKKVLESISGDRREAISNLYYRGSRIEDLCLDFTLPGYPDYALKPGGDSILVNIDNMEEYVSLVVDATVRTGIMQQMEAFRTGFNQVFPITSLQIFAENELDSLLCGGCSLWEPETLADNIRFDHGYTIQSPPILNLLEIMAGFTPDQQRAFLQFVTGSPRLPPGGLASLNPKLTIVRKNSSGVNGGLHASTFSSQAVDADLPSVMTCANYLKLPPYSGKEVMRDRLMYAITEGQGSFDLS